jgi:molybdopterin-binding protein
VSLISRETVDDLGLKPGELAVAVVKSTEVAVEVPPIID